MITRMLRSLTIFGRELIDNPRHIGAACPSSPSLARCIARLASIKPGGYIIELGAGTGAVTHALLEAGIPANHLIPVERSQRFASHLARRFPRVNVLNGDARNLRQVLRNLPRRQRTQIRCVVSSLPLRSLPVEDVEQILQSVREVLDEDGLFIQYTYAVGSGTALPTQFKPCGSAIVWLNLPPARVDVFALLAETAADFVRREKNLPRSLRSAPGFVASAPEFAPSAPRFE